jgi:hypothetical protein
MGEESQGAVLIDEVSYLMLYVNFLTDTFFRGGCFQKTVTTPPLAPYVSRLRTGLVKGDQGDSILYV